MSLFNKIWNHFSQRVIHDNRGIWPALAFLGNPAFWSGAANVAGAGTGIAGMFGGGGGGDENPYSDKMLAGNYALQQNNLAQQRTLRDWMQYYYPQMKELNENLMPLIQQRLKQPGLPPELEQQVWGLARQRLAKGYGDVENKLGNVLAGTGMMRSGPGIQSWMDKVALPRAQGEQQLGTDQALANYNAMQQAIQEAQQMMGMAPSPQGGGYSMPQQQQQQPVDYSSLGTLFAKGMGGIGGMFGRQPGTMIQGGQGGQTFNTQQFGTTWSPYK